MSPDRTGELAAIATAVCWSVGSLLFAETAKRAGAFALNQFRITLALFFLSSLFFGGRLLFRAPAEPLWPPVPVASATLLGISGVIGLAIGDLGYFGALNRLGPRLATALAAAAPPMTALIAWSVLGESLTFQAIAGMAVVLAGIVIVVLERGRAPIPAGHRLQGVLYGLFAAACQAIGLVLSKRGMQLGLEPLAANVVRMAAGTLGVWAVALVIRRPGALRRVVTDRKARYYGIGATLFGPTLGVWLSLVAARRTEAGIAATLMATAPVLILPLVIVVYRERVSVRGLLGALLTVAGVGLIFWR